MKVSTIPLHTIIALAAIVSVLSGCGSGSGAAVEQNPVTTSPEVSNYSGPPPQTADVQSFKLNVWDNLVSNNRCGSCHNEIQVPRFVRADDINLAYDAANTVVDLTDPAQSLMVTKVRGGHNCWLTSDEACGDIVQSFIEGWAGDSVGGAGKTVQLVAPPLIDPGASKNFPSSPASFAATVHPLLTQFCSQCHTDTAAIPQSPYFASADVDAAYEAAKPKIDLDTPADSRFVVRLREESHNCWSSSCVDDAAAMQQRIEQFASGITPTEIDPDLVTSKALGLTNGIVASSGGRHETNVIALYEFKTGSGSTAFDTSGVEPALNLTLSGEYEWVGGWGVAFSGGKAQGSTTASAKLSDLIKSTGEYSVEAWVAPGNVTQDGPARIVAYSGGPTNHNFLLGQTLYQYDFLNRADTTDQAGEPRLSTNADAEFLQATLQHVVVTYDPVNGRRVHVNGEPTGDVDPVAGGLLTDWNDTYALVVGSEVDNDNVWAGTVRLLAIHNRVLSDTQIRENFEAGVGQKFFLLFNVSDHVGIADAYIVFEVSQFDSYAYLFNKPFFVLLDESAMPGSIEIEGLRIGINGREAPVGQAYQNLDVTINDADYAVEGRQDLSRLGAVIALEKGPAEDQFFLTFERLGDATNVVIEPAPPPPAVPQDVPRGPMIGLRDFAEINATMSALTTVPATNSAVSVTYDLVHQAMPVATDIEGFLSSQQMGITQLAIKYCSVLVDDEDLRADYFPGFDFDAEFSSIDRNEIIDPLLARMMTGVTTQGDPTTVETELNNLMDRLAASPTPDVVKASCAAVLGSAVMLVQ